MKTKSYLFVFEGADGVGKTTLAKKTVNYLQTNDIPCEYLSSPGSNSGTLGEHIYRLHHDDLDIKTADMDPTSLQALHVAAHIDALENQIKPLLRNGTSVILDRTWWSTLVYGRVYGAKSETVELLVRAEKNFWGEITPDFTFFISRSKPLERDFSDNWRQLSSEYKKLFCSEKEKTPVSEIRNVNSIDTAINRIMEQIKAITDWQLDIDKTQLKKKVKSKKKGESIEIISSWQPAEVTEVFDTYWTFAAERQSIFFERFENSPPPWTPDPVLQTYKFTNAYRASDRVSQYLIRHVIYDDDYQSRDPNDTFFRIMLFKIFNKIRTWELLEEKLGEIHYEGYSYGRYDDLVTKEMAKGNAVFSGAYIMPSGSSSFGKAKKHRNYLKLLEKMIDEEVPKRIQHAAKMREAFEILLDYPSIGEFLAYQFVTDINYSEMTDFSEMEFVVPGPGAKSGIRKCFKNTGGLSEVEIIKRVTDRQNVEFENRGIEFQTLWGRPLQLIDCQNLFCEVDKYSRVAHPTVEGIGNRSRIKQKYKQRDKSQIDYWYPPKWNINDKIAAHQEQLNGDSG